MKSIFYFILIFCCSIFNYGFDLEYKINLKNKGDFFIVRDTELNPENIFHQENIKRDSSELNLDAKVYILDSLSFTFLDTPYVKVQGQKGQDFGNQFKEAFLSYSPSQFVFIDAGRKVVKKGVGFFKNPVDFIQYPNPQDIDFSRTKSEQNRMLKGVYLSKAEIFAGECTFSFLYSPQWREIKQDQNQYYFNAGFKISQFDIEWILYYGDQAKTGLNLSLNIGNNIVFHLEAAIWQRDYVKELSYSYGYLVQKDQRKAYPVNLLTGILCSLGENTNLYLEYYYHHSGYSKKEWDSFYDKIQENQNIGQFNQMLNQGVLNGTYISQGGFSEFQKHYGFIRYEKNKCLGNLNLVISSVVEIQNFGTLFILNPSYTFTDNLILNFYYFQPLGEKQSESRLMYYSQVSLELDFYF